MERPVHIIRNKSRYAQRFGPGKWFNLLTDETYAGDDELTEYLSTYKPMVYWTTWENHKKSKLKAA